MKLDVQVTKVRNTSWPAQEKTDANRGGYGKGGGEKNKNLKALYGVCQ